MNPYEQGHFDALQNLVTLARDGTHLDYPSLLEGEQERAERVENVLGLIQRDLQAHVRQLEDKNAASRAILSTVRDVVKQECDAIESTWAMKWSPAIGDQIRELVEHWRSQAANAAASHKVALQRIDELERRNTLTPPVLPEIPNAHKDTIISLLGVVSNLVKEMK